MRAPFQGHAGLFVRLCDNLLCLLPYRNLDPITGPCRMNIEFDLCTALEDCATLCTDPVSYRAINAGIDLPTMSEALSLRRTDTGSAGRPQPNLTARHVNGAPTRFSVCWLSRAE